MLSSVGGILSSSLSISHALLMWAPYDKGASFLHTRPVGEPGLLLFHHTQNASPGRPLHISREKKSSRVLLRAKSLALPSRVMTAAGTGTRL